MILYQNFSRMLTATQKREVGRFSRNRVVLGFDPKDGWLVVGAWLKKWLGWMDQDGMVVGWLSSGWTDGCVRMGQDKDGWSADE